MTYKLTCILLLSLPFCSVSKLMAQQKPSLSSHRVLLSVSGGLTRLHGDVQKGSVPGGVGKVAFDYVPNSFLTSGLEIGFGSLASGDRTSTKLFSRGSFFTANLNARVYPARIATDRLSEMMEHGRGAYVGAGVGFINSNITSIREVTAKGKVLANIKKTESAFTIPINAGWDIVFGDKWNIAINVNYQYNIVFSDYLDGYNFDISNNRHNDAFSGLTLGIRWYIDTKH